MIRIIGPTFRRGRRAACALAGIGSWIASASAHAGWDVLNMTRGVTPISEEVYDLHMLILWICILIGIVVFGAMFVSMWLHRKSRGVEAAQFHHSTTAEFVWTAIPFFILVGMAFPATNAAIRIEDTSEPDLTVKVTGYQWMWRYQYLDEGVTIYSRLDSKSRAAMNGDPSGVQNYLLDVDNPIVLPVGKKVRILLTSDDVIHAWWVPDLGMKRDAIPGFLNKMWVKIDENKPGIYRGQCAELCGKDHGFMPIVVIAKTEQEYAAWLDEQRAVTAAREVSTDRAWSRDALMERGESVYASACATCHQLDGAGVPDVFPAIKGSSVVTGSVDEHMNVVMNGRLGTAMKAFGAHLDDVSLAAVLTYQRNAFGNATGDMIQPVAIRAARGAL
ncbi:MAG: cytochrome c oxidase subunit II [Gammaproteobacteria bacterium]